VNTFYRNIGITTSIILLVLADMFFKWMAVNLKLPFVANSGVALSFLSSSSNLRGVTISITVILFIIFLILSESRYFQKLDKFQFVGLLLMVCGGASNLMDRLIYGSVVDYLHIAGFPWFNIADVLIFMGVISIVWGMRTNKKL